MKKFLILFFVTLIFSANVQSQNLKSVIYDFDGLDIGQTDLPEGDYHVNDLVHTVATNPFGNSDMLGDRVLKLNLNWSTGYGAFGRGISRYVEFDPTKDYFNFYFYNPTSNNALANFDVVITEDDDQSLTYSIDKDDAWIKSFSIAGGGSWQKISVPLSDFYDSNAGGNGVFDADFTQNKGMLLMIEFRFHGPASGSANFYLDMVSFTDGPLATGLSVLNFPNPGTLDKCPLGAYEGKPKGQEYQIPGEVESFFPATPGRKLKYVNYFLQFGMDGTAQAKALPGDEVTKMLAAGYTPIITWEPQFQGFDRLDPVQPRNNNISSGQYDSYIDQFADQLKSYNDTVIIRFMHEFEGNWYPWSITANNNDPNNYILAFRHVVDRVKARGATKVKWMWCVNSDYAPYRYYNWFVKAYPGDSYVDIIATDIYNSHYPVDLPWWLSFRYRTTESYYYLQKYFPNKPMMICEVGCRERKSTENSGSQTKGKWIERMDKELQTYFSKIHGLVFFSSNNENDWRINSSQTAIDSMYKNIWLDDYYFEKKPSINISNPSNNSTFYEGATINFTVSIANSDTIRKVEYFNGATKIGESVFSPFSISLSRVPIGNYSITAKATDKNQKTITSPAITFQVLDNSQFITQGSNWKFLDNGTNQGTSWRLNNFSDATWKNGNAELGYGDGDESTVISFGPSSGSKYITTYFRKSFNVTDKTLFNALDLSILKDDGAVVYLNGTEIYRTNMPSGTIGYTTLAITSLSAPEESTFENYSLSSALLLNGENVLAVEVHQSTGGSSDVSFNLKLTGKKTSAICNVPVNLQASGITSSSAALNWSQAQGATNYKIQYRNNSNSWISTTAANNSFNLTGLNPSTTYEYQVQTICNGGQSAFSASYFFTTQGSATLIGFNDVWKYLDNGTNLGATWKNNSYNDAGWKSGAAELGYGDGDEATKVGYGSSSSNKYVTTYFRKTFQVSDVSAIPSLILDLVRDDGAIVYLNGNEVWRTNMPNGTVDYRTYANVVVDGTAEKAVNSKKISTQYLQNGTNVLAIEIHQSSGTSSDISFMLKVSVGTGPAFALESQPETPEITKVYTPFSVKAFPNPIVGKQFTLEITSDEDFKTPFVYQLYDIKGRLVYEAREFISQGIIRENILLSESIAKGTYVLKVQCGKYFHSDKLIFLGL